MDSLSSRPNNCGCRITEPAGGQFEIEYCSVHEAAPDMLERGLALWQFGEMAATQWQIWEDTAGLYMDKYKELAWPR